jgi:type III restriction enzyme
MAAALTRDYVAQPSCEAPAQALFPQLRAIVERYLRQKVQPVAPAEILDVSLSPYYAWVIERLVGQIKPDTSQGEAPLLPIYETRRGAGTTGEVDFWTSRDVREVARSHLNYVVADTAQWEQSAAYFIDTHEQVEAFAKNDGLGFAIPYIHNGQPHDYMPDFIVRLKSEPPVHVILEVKGFDALKEVKGQAARRWVEAVNADASYGRWEYCVVNKPTEVDKVIAEFGRPSEAISNRI